MVFHFCTFFLNKAVLVSYQVLHWHVEEQCLASVARDAAIQESRQVYGDGDRGALCLQKGNCVNP